MNPKGVVILGATGSIGKSAARVLEALPGHFRVIGLVARNNTGELARQAALFRSPSHRDHRAGTAGMS